MTSLGTPFLISEGQLYGFQNLSLFSGREGAHRRQDD